MALRQPVDGGRGRDRSSISAVRPTGKAWPAALAAAEAGAAAAERPRLSSAAPRGGTVGGPSRPERVRDRRLAGPGPPSPAPPLLPCRCRLRPADGGAAEESAVLDGCAGTATACRSAVSCSAPVPLTSSSAKVLSHLPVPDIDLPADAAAPVRHAEPRSGDPPDGAIWQVAGVNAALMLSGRADQRYRTRRNFRRRGPATSRSWRLSSPRV